MKQEEEPATDDVTINMGGETSTLEELYHIGGWHPRHDLFMQYVAEEYKQKHLKEENNTNKDN